MEITLWDLWKSFKDLQQQQQQKMLNQENTIQNSRKFYEIFTQTSLNHFLWWPGIVWRNHTQQCSKKKIINQMVFIPGMEGCFSILKSINIVHHSNRMMKNNNKNICSPELMLGKHLTKFNNLSG